MGKQPKNPKPTQEEADKEPPKKSHKRVASEDKNKEQETASGSKDPGQGSGGFKIPKKTNPFASADSQTKKGTIKYVTNKFVTKIKRSIN